MCGGSSPPPPDPYATAQAQNQINQQAIAGAAKYNQVNQSNPFGSLSYSGSYDDPNDPRTQNVTLNPALQKLLTGQEGISQGLTDAASSRIQGLAGMSQFQLPTNPNGYQYQSSGIESSFNPGGPLQSSAGSGGSFTRDVNGGPIQSQLNTGGVQRISDSSQFGAQAQQAQQAAYDAQTGLLAPHEAQANDQLRSQLAAQGIEQGTPAYDHAINNQNEQQNMIRQQAAASAVGVGNQQQGALFGQNLAGSQAQFQQALQSGQFGNEAQALSFGQGMQNAQLNNQATNDQFGQNVTNAQLNNSAAGQQFGQNAALAQFYNQALGQADNRNLQYGQYNQNLYQSNLQNDILGRNQNFNEAAAFLNGSPVAPSNPNFANTTQYQPSQASPNAIGLAGQNYQTQSQSAASGLGSIFGAVGNIGAAAAPLMMGCWVAHEVYDGTARWLEMREWMRTKAPAALRNTYMRYGEQIAEMIKGNNPLRAHIREQMEAVLG